MVDRPINDCGSQLKQPRAIGNGDLRGRHSYGNVRGTGLAPKKSKNPGWVVKIRMLNPLRTGYFELLAIMAEKDRLTSIQINLDLLNEAERFSTFNL